MTDTCSTCQWSRTVFPSEVTNGDAKPTTILCVRFPQPVANWIGYWCGEYLRKRPS